MSVKIDIQVIPDFKFTNRVAIVRKTITNGRISLEMLSPKGEWMIVPEGSSFEDDCYYTIEHHEPKPKLYIVSDGYYVPDLDGHVFCKAVQ